MTIINQAGVTATGTLGGISAAEIALANHADLGAWWNAKHDQQLLSALPWRARNTALKYFELEDPEMRPTPVTVSGMPFFTSPTGSTAPYSVPRSTANVMPLTGNWTMFCVTSGFGSAPISPAVSLVGNGGHALSIRVRSSSLIDVGIDLNSPISGLQTTTLAAGLHMTMLAYDRAINTAYLYVDNTYIGGRVLTGFTQQRADLTLLSIIDETGGLIGGGRGCTIGDVMVATTNAHVNAGIVDVYSAALEAIYGADITLA